MSETFQPNLDFKAVEEVDASEAFVVDLEGYEGPLHVLLALARTQKVDLLKLSITRLAEQYLAFVHEARRRNFSLAADYLVMASWLAYLKSRLLLPRTDKGKAEEPPAEVIAAALAFRLKKLEAMRKAVDDLTARPQLKRDVFTRGDPEATVIVPSDQIDASLYELMAAYVTQRRPLVHPGQPLAQPVARRLQRESLDPVGQPGAGEGGRDEHSPGRGFRGPVSEAPPGGAGAGADAVSLSFSLEPEEIERRIEALLFAAAGPLSLNEIARRLPEGVDVEAGIQGLKARYEGRGVELEMVADRWRFRTAPDLAFMMTEEREEPRRLSKAALETLAIIAYHQPCTRAEIESVRGVSLSKGTLDLLLEMGFVRLRGRRRTPGRPVTYGTADRFLEHFGLANLYDLPGVQEMKAAGLLDLSMPVDFELPDPSRAGDDAEEDLLDLDDANAPEFAQDFVGEDDKR